HGSLYAPTTFILSFFGSLLLPPLLSLGVEPFSPPNLILHAIVEPKANNDAEHRLDDLVVSAPHFEGQSRDRREDIVVIGRGLHLAVVVEHQQQIRAVALCR